MIRKQQKRKKKRRAWGLIILTILLILAVAALVVVKVFTVERVVVTGNDLYQDEMIREWVLNDEYSWNSLYVYLKYRFREPEAIPFVDTMEITMKPPHTVEIHVYEKGLLGYLYLDSLGKNAYFDKDGFVVETSSEVIEEVPRVSGLKVDAVVLYERLPIKDSKVLKNLLSLTQTLKKYELVPDHIICGEDKTYTLEYGSVKVLLGTAVNFSDKILRMTKIMPQLEGMSGTLHLESWTQNTTDITFKKDD